MSPANEAAKPRLSRKNLVRLLLSVLTAVAALASFAIAAVAGRAAVGTFYDFLTPPEGVAAFSHGGVFDLVVLLVFVPVNRMLAGWSRRTRGPAAVFHRLHSWTLGGIALLAVLPVFIDINFYLIVSAELLMFAIQLLLLTFILTAFAWRSDGAAPREV
jgi:hypothetical protein